MEPVSTAAPGLSAYAAAAAPQGWGAGRQRGQLCLWGLMGSVGQHWPLLSVCLLFWPTLESEEGGDHLAPTPSPQFDMN